LEDVEIREIRETMERGKASEFTKDDQGMISVCLMWETFGRLS
jgi:hypothetical protein